MTTSDSLTALDIRDLTRMRVIITVEMGSTQPWAQIQAAGSDHAQHDSQRWRSGPLRVLSHDQREQSDFFSDDAQHSDVLNPEFGRLLVDGSIRQHLLLPSPQVFIVEETRVLQVEALDLLHVRSTPGGGFRALLSIHAHVLTHDRSYVHSSLRSRKHILKLVKLVRRLLATEGSLKPNTIYFPGHEKDPEDPAERLPFPPPPFLSFWIPSQLVARACASHTHQRSALAALGWKWTHLPGPHGIAFDEQQIDEADAQLEVFSQSWAISVAEFAVAYLPRRDDRYIHRAITHVFTSHNDVCLLVLRTRLLLKFFSSQVAKLARDLSNLLSLPTTPSPDSPKRDATDKSAGLNLIVDQAIHLDAEVAAFLASTWGRDVSSRDHLDILLGRLQAVGYLEADISHLTEQARWLRESTQTLIDREEHLLDQKRAVIEERRQQSADALNWMLAALTILGVPLAVTVELFASDKLPDCLLCTSAYLLGASIAIPLALRPLYRLYQKVCRLKTKWKGDAPGTE